MPDASGTNAPGSEPRRHAALCVRCLRLLDAPSFPLVCVLLFLIPRAALLVAVPLHQTSDFLWYFDSAAGIAAGQGYRDHGNLTAFWPVGWPGALAALFTITGPMPLAGQIANLAMAGGACLLTAFLGGTLSGHRRAGRLAALMIALYPNQIAYVPLLSVEIFYQLILLACLCLLARGRTGAAPIAGVLFGIATLTKAQTLTLPLFLLPWVFLLAPRRPAPGRFLRLAAVLHIAMILTVSPWTYRNWTVFHAFIPVSTNGGWTLLTGNNPEATGRYTPDTVLTAGMDRDPAHEPENDRQARQRAIAWIEGDPAAFIALLPRKIMGLWALDGEAEWFYQKGFDSYEAHRTAFRTVRLVNQGYYGALLLLAVPSLWLVVRRRDRGRNAWAAAGFGLCVYFTLITMVFSGQPRFHFALMPYIAIHAAWTVVRWCGASDRSGSSLG